MAENTEVSGATISGYFKKYLGRYPTPEDIDWYKGEISKNGIEWFDSHLASSEEALLYKETGIPLSTSSGSTTNTGTNSGSTTTGGSASTGSTGSTSGTNNTGYLVDANTINNYFKQYLGRNATSADLEWYGTEAAKYGEEWLKNHISSSEEALLYKETGIPAGTTTGTTGTTTGTTGTTAENDYSYQTPGTGSGTTSSVFNYQGDWDNELTKAYQTYLGRQPDPVGMEHYKSQLSSGTKTLQDVIGEIGQSAEQNAAGTITAPGLGQAVSGATSARTTAVGQNILGNLTNPTLPEGAEQTYTNININQNEISDPTDPRFQIGQQQGATAQTGQAAAPVGTGTLGTSTYNAATIGQGAAGTEQAAQGQTLDPNAVAEAVIGNLPPEAMVQSQMEELVNGIQNGQIPNWARPAVDAVEAQLAARGLSRSSVGQAALTNAIIQTALPMAQQNAQAVTQNFMQDKTAQNQMELANATASQQLQFRNLDNQQQMNMLNAQMRQQALLSDQAAQNAAKQFNAASENQTAQFMENLRTTVDMSNAARLDAMTQFNVNQQNAVSQFNANVRFQRDQFNAQNATVIEQSNLQWRRQVNQMNTAGINAVNQANAMNRFNLSNQALTFMWQELRDNAKWAFEATQNDLQRKAALAQAALGNEASIDAEKQKSIAALGAAAFNVWNEYLKA